MSSVTIGRSATVSPVEPGARNTVQPLPVPASAALVRGGSQHPNPSLRLDSQLGLVVIEFFDASGAVSRTIPSAQQLAAYRQWSETGHGADPLTAQAAYGGTNATEATANTPAHKPAGGVIGHPAGDIAPEAATSGVGPDRTIAATIPSAGPAPTSLTGLASGVRAAGPAVGGASSGAAGGETAAPATGASLGPPAAT